MASYNTYNSTTVVLIIAAVLGIISFFTGWMCIESDSLDCGAHLCFTGYGMLDSNYKDVFEGYAYIPLFVLILSVLSLVIAFLPKMGLNVDAGRYGLMLILIGLVTLILIFLFGLNHFEYMDFRETGFAKAGAGLILAIIFAVLDIIGGAMPALTRRL